jgi:hypothetical protein
MTRPTVERRQRLPKLPHTKFVAIFFEMPLRDFIHVLLPQPSSSPRDIRDQHPVFAKTLADRGINNIAAFVSTSVLL